ncbi:hypothetical protein [Flavobacterium sp. HJJ]|uniref:hypothetical protein n=1 Tax=Flavobacterium sp. HJJ TaxID=2783792 RepID=UPI00188BC192|nr:hypothetical protein [Flavobacterium sp. HJJ]MBF4470707.1 hypothetical protein [Flavobacterium sp. HJJ]
MIKKTIVKIFGFFLTFFLIISCEKNNDLKVNLSIENINKKFPQLKANKKVPENEFKFEKSLRNGEFNFEIQLYSQPEGFKERNQIIVLINSKNEVYSIPLFANKYKDYWEFPNDKLIPNVTKINTTFTKQINSAIDSLVPNSDRRKERKSYIIINEILTSVLNCKNIQEKDSAMVYKTLRMNYDIPDEDSDSALIRLRKNYELMKPEWHPGEYYINYNCYFDERYARIYQLNFVGNKIKIKTYRMDYGDHLMYL